MTKKASFLDRVNRQLVMKKNRDHYVTLKQLGDKYVAVDALKACYSKNPPIPCLVEPIQDGTNNNQDKKKDGV